MKLLTDSKKIDLGGTYIIISPERVSHRSSTYANMKIKMSFIDDLGITSNLKYIINILTGITRGRYSHIITGNNPESTINTLYKYNDGSDGGTDHQQHMTAAKIWIVAIQLIYKSDTYHTTFYPGYNDYGKEN